MTAMKNPDCLRRLVCGIGTSHNPAPATISRMGNLQPGSSSETRFHSRTNDLRLARKNDEVWYRSLSQSKECVVPRLSLVARLSEPGVFALPSRRLGVPTLGVPSSPP